MEIVQVSVHPHRRLIPVQGWENVTKALNAYASGSTRHKTVEAIDRSSGSEGGIAVGLFLLTDAVVGNRSQLVDNLLYEASRNLKDRTEFNKDYDYDGMGTPFFKTSVDVKVLDRHQDMYAIGIYASYVGDKPEQELADHFGIPRTLLSCLVEVEINPVSNNRFEFDFEPVLRKLDSVLDTKKIAGQQVAAAMLATENNTNPVFLLERRGGLEIRIEPGRVERRMKYSTGDTKDTWSVKGSVFAGELQRDYSSGDENAKANPTLRIVISSSQKDDWRHSLPIWQPDQQQSAIDLAERVAAVLR
jgi:hypothetical protein